MSDNTECELHFVVLADEVKERGLTREFETTEAERAAIAKRLVVDGMSRLSGKVKLSRLGNDAVSCEGRYKAEIQQTCVVTLEPITVEQHGTLSVVFAAATEEASAPKGRDGAEFELKDLEGDAVAMAPEGAMDVGEQVLQQIALDLDPYPRKTGVEFETTPESADEDKRNPFEALASLKTALKDED